MLHSHVETDPGGVVQDEMYKFKSGGFMNTRDGDLIRISSLSHSLSQHYILSKNVNTS